MADLGALGSGAQEGELTARSTALLGEAAGDKHVFEELAQAKVAVCCVCGGRTCWVRGKDQGLGCVWGWWGVAPVHGLLVLDAPLCGVSVWAAQPVPREIMGIAQEEGR